MSFVPIVTKCYEPLVAAHVSINDDRYDVAECGAVSPAAKSPNWPSQISHDEVALCLSELSD